MPPGDRPGRRVSAMVSGLAELDDLIGTLGHDAPFPANADPPRGRQGRLEDPDDD